MASLTARASHSVPRYWSNAVAKISRSVGGALSSSVLQYRSYSDEGLEGRVPLSPDASSAAAAIDPPSEEIPPDVATPGTVGPGRFADERDTYPPRNYRTPRGVYKAILLGEVGYSPVQKILKSGRSVTIFSVGTGGMYNNRKPFDGETPEEFADRSYTQWHRVAVYQDRVGSMVMQHVKVGSQVYLEGNIECRVYNDPNSGIVKRVREIAIRSNGRLMFMDTPSSTVAAPPPA